MAAPLKILFGEGGSARLELVDPEQIERFRSYAGCENFGLSVQPKGPEEAEAVYRIVRVEDTDAGANVILQMAASIN